MGTLVKENFGETEKKKRDGRIRRKRKEVVGCVQDVTGKKNFLVKM